MIGVETELARLIMSALNNPFAIQILLYLLYRREAKLTDILMEVTGYSKYRSVKKAILHLERAGLIKREVVSWGRVKKWVLRLTGLGERLIVGIEKSIKSVLKESKAGSVKGEFPQSEKR